MSLSKAPIAEISFTTAHDISDELLGGAISFCRTTGYTPNITMLTFFWAGLLLSAKDQLEEHYLVDDVLRCYRHSLESAFPKIANSNQDLQSVDEMCRHYWSNLSNDFSRLNNDAELKDFFYIADKIHSQDNISASYLIKADSKHTFTQISSNISSSIYQIVHQIDNGIGIRYRGILDQIRLGNSQTKTTVSHTPAAHATSVADSKKNSDDAMPWGRMIVCGLLIIGFFAFIIWSALSVSNSEPSTPEATTTPFSAMPEPTSGTILSGREDPNGSELTIIASSGSSCVIKLKTASGVTRLSFYVRAGDTVTIRVPAEHLYVYFASGSTWYGESHLFGNYTSYSMDDELLDFSQYSWTYTLYPVNNGNFSETPIDAEDFA